MCCPPRSGPGSLVACIPVERDGREAPPGHLRSSYDDSGSSAGTLSALGPSINELAKRVLLHMGVFVSGAAVEVVEDNFL